MTNSERRKAFNKALRKAIADYENQTAESLLALNAILNSAREQIVFRLRRSPSDYDLYLLPALEAQIGAIMTGVSRQSVSVAQQALASGWLAGELIVDAPLSAAGVAINGIAPAIDTRQLLALQHVTTNKIQGVTSAMATNINTQLGLVMMGVQSSDTAVTVITNILDETDRGRALGILRTEISRANSIASHLRKLSAATVVPGMQKQWRRSGRKHPRASHSFADGQVQDMDKPFMIGGVPMMHPHDPAAPIGEVINCGCQALPYMKSWTMSRPGAIDVPT